MTRQAEGGWFRRNPLAKRPTDTFAAGYSSSGRPAKRWMITAVMKQVSLPNWESVPTIRLYGRPDLPACATMSGTSPEISLPRVGLINPWVSPILFYRSGRFGERRTADSEAFAPGRDHPARWSIISHPLMGCRRQEHCEGLSARTRARLFEEPRLGPDRDTPHRETTTAESTLGRENTGAGAPTGTSARY